MQCLSVKLELIVIALCLFNVVISSEILIIRHGRSRSRHSIQKSHVQWGLKALDNLTLVENHDGSLEFSEIEANNELNILNLYVNNTSNTQSQSSELNGTIGSFEINFTHNPDPSKSTKKQTNFVDWLRAERTTEIPKSSSSIKPTLEPSSSSSVTAAPSTSKEQRKNVVGEKKEEIMLNIKNTVDKGIQYLKSHENLNEIKIEINDKHFHREIVSTNADAMKQQHSNQIPRSQFIPVAIKMDKPLSSSHLSNPASLLHHQQQQQHQQRKHKEAQQAKEIKINGGKELGIVTILTSQSHHDEIENVFPHRHPMKKSHLSHSSASLLEMSKQQREKNRQSHIINSNQLDSSFADVFYVPSSTEEPMLGDQPMETSSTSHNITSQADKSQSSEKNSSSRTDTAQHDLVASQMTDKIDRETSENIQNDGEVSVEIENNYEVEGIEGEPMEVEEFEFDLDLDETSKQNRKNLKRGRDVVTRFLQIVESQHVLGGNCTAGTALNLGEGVVDRYAQDRFRVEAEVAVNRANMLSR